MKTAISLPDDVFIQAEKLSKRKHLSRSELYANAIRWYVQKEGGQDITKQLDKVYGENPFFDQQVESAAISDLGKEDW